MTFLSSIQKIFAPRKRIIGSTDLKRALANNEFVFYYQPECDLKTGKIAGVEALIRWESPTGIIPPNDFIPVLEETGVINEFTPFLFNKTLQDLRELHSLGFSDLFLSVNLSTVQLRNSYVLSVIGENLAKYEIAPEYLECEVTETNTISTSKVEFQTLKELQEKGIKISIDDFGSGHASLNYVKDMNPYKIKIDRDFIISLFDKPANQTIMNTIIELGHSLNLVVLAEGIEKPEQAEWLKKADCDYGQGFLFSRPLPLSMLIPVLRENLQKPYNE